jgi:hypothetical protein
MTAATQMAQLISHWNAPVTVSFGDTGSDSVNRTTYNFTTLSIGTAATNRYVLAVVCANAAAALTISSVTIAGVAATPIYDVNYGGGGTFRVAAYIALVPTGTTGDVDVTWSGSASNCQVGVWALYNLNSIVALDTASDITTNSSPTLNVDTWEGGVAIGVTMGNVSATTVWTGLTEDFDQITETVGFSGASASTVAAFPRSISATLGGTQTAQTAIAFSLR